MRFHLTKPVPACRMGSLGCLLQGLERMGGPHSAAPPVTPGARRAVASGRRRGTQGPLPPAAGGAADILLALMEALPPALSRVSEAVQADLYTRLQDAHALVPAHSVP